MSVRQVMRIIIDLVLIKSGIETNPGPKDEINLIIRTFNCNGLGDRDKFRRILRKIGLEIKNGGIVMLQETHVMDEDLIKLYWKMNYVTSCVSTQSAGVLTLFDNSFTCLESHSDNGGRMAIAVIESDIETLSKGLEGS